MRIPRLPLFFAATLAVPALAADSNLLGVASPTAGTAGTGSPLVFSGELRLRHDVQSSDGAITASDQQDRIAAKLGLGVTITPKTRGEFRIGSGQGRTSLNQTLGENNSQFGNYALTLDRASLEHEPFGGLKLLGGRFRNIHHHPGGNDLLFDWDLNFDGWGAQYEQATAFGKIFGATTYSWVKKGTTSTTATATNAGPDIHLFSAQLGSTVAVTSATKVTASAGLFRYDHLQGSVPASAKGNTLAGGAYAYNYRIGQAGAEVGTKVQEIPTTVGFDFTRNFEAPTQANAWIASARLGNAKVKGGFALLYDYRRVGKDAIVGNFTEAEVVNGQGTDSRAHRAKLSYGVDDGMMISILGSKGKSKLSSSPQRDDRYQADWTIWF